MKGRANTRCRTRICWVRQDLTVFLSAGILALIVAGCSDGGVVVGIDVVDSSLQTPLTKPDTDLTTDSTTEPANDATVETATDPVIIPVSDPAANQGPQISLAELGQRIFDDENLSMPIGQSCASCHTQSTGFIDPDVNHPSSLGANSGNFGVRNTPTLFYIDRIPDFQLVERPNPLTQIPQDFEFGGFFLDGRAATLEEQAKLPFFNPKEMALPSRQEFATRIQQSEYSQEFQAHFGEDVFGNADRTLDSAVIAIAAFERTSRFSPFNSKFDLVKQGQETFTAAEARGESLFNGRATCNLCHASPTDPDIFSDFLYHNVGTPRNETLLSDIGDPSFIDLGLGAITGNTANNGQFRTPTLRNIAITAPYMHNGVFRTLREVVEFYNSGVASAEVAGNIPPFFGNLLLSETDVDDLVAFLNTLTDRP